MRDNKAIRPDKVFFNLPTFVKKTEKKGIDEESVALATLSESAGWKALRDYIDQIVKDLDKVNEVAISSGASFEEIGRNTLVINLAKGVIERIVDKVLDAKEELEQRPGEKD